MASQNKYLNWTPGPNDEFGRLEATEMSTHAPTTLQAVPISHAEVDLLIIGSGTGLATALAAHELGLTVAVAEKTLHVGGSTARSGGAIWLPGNPVLAEDGSTDTVESATEYLEATVADSSPRERWQTVLDLGPESVRMLGRTTTLKFNWVEGYSDYFAEVPGGNPEGRSIESRPHDLSEMGPSRERFQPAVTPMPYPLPVTSADYKWVTLSGTMPSRAEAIMLERTTQGQDGQRIGKEYAAGGQALAGGLYAGALRANIPVWTGAELVDLVSEDGRVVGARLLQGGVETTVRAKRGVVLATGGFDHNMEMRRTYQSPTMHDDLSFGAAGNTGDGILIAQRVGAAIDGMDQAWWFPAVAPAGSGSPLVMLAERALPGSLIVDSAGERFVNEAVGYLSFGQEVMRRERTGDPVGTMWMVFDQQYRDSYMYAGMVPPTMDLPEDLYEAGIAHRATSAAALAAAIGVPGTALGETLARFNEGAAAGTDQDYGRGSFAYDRYYGDPTHEGPNPNLRPINEQQLYAVQLVMSDLGTCGGIRADGNGRVLDDERQVIPGLYAQGNTAANAFGDVYPGAGATIGQGIVYGLMIAREAGRERDQGE